MGAEYHPEWGDPGAIEEITPGDTATGPSDSTIRPTSGIHQDLQAKTALVVVEDNAINFTIDGTSPTAEAGTDVGITMAAGQNTVLYGHNAIRNFLCIDRVSGSASKVKFQPFF